MLSICKALEWQRQQGCTTGADPTSTWGQVLKARLAALQTERESAELSEQAAFGLISAILHGVLGTEPREWTSCHSCLVFEGWSVPPVQWIHGYRGTWIVPVFLLWPGSLVVATADVLCSTLWSFWRGLGYTFTKQCKAYILSVSFQHC